jgi:hypothetical protein
MAEDTPPTINGVHEPADPYDLTDQNALRPRAYNLPGQHRFAPGNPGRPPGIRDKRHKSAQELIELAGLEPLAVKLQLLQRLQAKLDKGEWKSDYEELETEKLLNQVTTDLLQYRHPKLKAVEHVGQLEIIQQLQALDRCSDEELKRLMEECEAMMKQLPPTR